MSKAKVVQTHISYGKPQELTNIITHAIGAALGFVGLVFLLLKCVGEASVAPLGVAAVTVFGVMLTAVFALNLTAHCLPSGKARDVFLRLEKSTVPMLMLGVFAPVMLIGFVSGSASDAIWGYVLFAVIAALTTAVVVLCAVDAGKFRIYRLALYVLLVWASVMRADLVYKLCGEPCFWLLFGGAASYALGMIFYSVKNISAGRALFAVLAVAGAAMHFAAVYTYLL